MGNPDRAHSSLPGGVCFAAASAAAWLTYGTVELLFVAGIPFILGPSYRYQPVRADVTLALLAAYGAFGALCGLIAGGILRLLYPAEELSALTWRTGRVAVAAVVVACMITPVSRMWPHPWRSPMIWLYAMPLGLALAGLWMTPWRSRFRFATGAWPVTVLCLGIPWLLEDRMAASHGWTKPLAAGAFLVVVLALAFAAQVARPVGGPRPGFRLAGAAGIALVACAIAASLHAGIRILPDSAPAGPAGRPNILLITMDTVREDHLSVYGYKRRTTPNLEQFSKTAVRYDMALANGDMTLASHGSIFTGVYPSQHGAHFDTSNPWGQALGHSYRTLAEILRDKGFHTIGVAANQGYLVDKFGLDRGFDTYDERAPAAGFVLLPEYYLREGIREVIRKYTPASELYRKCRDGADIDKSALRQVGQAPKNRPWLLFLNYMDAHYPYIPPAPYNDLFPGRDPRFPEARFDEIKQDVFRRRRSIRPAEREHLVSQYDGGIAYLDHQLGVLFARFKSLGLWDNTMVIVTSDHGEVFGRRDLMEHGISVYQDQIHVPLLIKYPHQRQPGVVGEPVSGVDILPTVLDVAGIAVPARLEGTSLWKLKPGAKREIVSESYPGGPAYFADARFHRTERALVNWPFKMVVSTAGKRELYDLSRDADETQNIYSPGDPSAQTLELTLNRWSGTHSRQRPATALDPETLGRLKSLGYVQ